MTANGPVSLSYFSNTHCTDKLQRPDLYRHIMIRYDEKLENFCILLSDDASTASATLANLPTNEDWVKALTNMQNVDTVNSGETGVEINKPRAVMWIEKNNKIQWYLGYILDINEESKTFEVDHLHCHPED